MDQTVTNALALADRLLENSDHPVITYTVPCYNSAEYMDHCISSLLTGSDDIEIIIVNDGSSDDTAAKGR